MVKFGFLVAASALFATPLFAQVSGGERDERCGQPVCRDVCVSSCPIRFDIIVTASSAGQAPEKSGRAVTLLNQDALAKLQIQNVVDLLATTAGVAVSSNGPIGGFSAIRIRGAEGEQTLTLIDGVRANDPASPGGGFDFGNLLTGNIERIEVLRGPNSVPWGSQAIGGVVNLITAKVPSDFGGHARAEYGYSERTNLVANAGGKFGILSAQLGGGYFRDDGISAFKDGRERDGYRQYAASGKVDVEIANNFNLDFRANYANSRTQIDGFPPPFFSFADTPEFSRAKEFYGYAGANLGLFGDKLKNRVAFTLADINRDNFDVPGQATPSFLARGRTERFEYQGDARLGRRLRAVFGAEHETSRLNDGFTPLKTSVTSGYAQLIFDPTDNLTLTGGARIDDHKAYGTRSTFSGNLAWRPGRNTIIRAAYGEGFKAPTLFQLFSFFGNATLKPERAKSYEVGVEQKLLSEKVTVSATLFQRNTTSQIDFISCFGQTTGICTNRPFGTYDNVDRARARGLEAVIAIRPTDKLTIDANYTLLDTEDRTTGLNLVRRPRHSFNLSADWEAREWLKLGASLRVASKSADTDFQTFTRTSLGGYSLTTLRASAPINETLELYARVENLFNTHYETVSGYGTYGRNAHIGVRAKF